MKSDQIGSKRAFIDEKLKNALSSHGKFHYWPIFYEYCPPVDCKVALSKDHRKKNHTPYGYPYDYNLITSVPFYINASPMSFGKQRYIATQGPRKSTFFEFWNMVWAEGSELIVTVTNEREEEEEDLAHSHKFDAFWPNEKLQTFGDISIAIISEQVIMEWQDGRPERIHLRKMQASRGAHTRTVHQLHMENWMDGDIIEADSLTALSAYADKLKGDGPIIVHCAAGIGRTGTFIAFHSLYHDMHNYLANEDEEVLFDVIERISEMRRLRYGTMVAEKRQLFLLVQALENVLNEI